MVPTRKVRSRKGQAPEPVAPAQKRAWKRTRGQALLIVALSMTALVLFVGLGVDVGNLMGKRAKLQAAVDASALSAAQTLVGSQNITQTIATVALTKTKQILESNNVPLASLSRLTVNAPPNTTNEVHVGAVQNVNTFFMRLIPIFTTMQVSADATADVNSYAEIYGKPYGQWGVVNELNISVWGVESWRKGGDAYSPAYDSGTITNTYYPQMPYGYLYRVDVPANFTTQYRDSSGASHVVLQIFDPDSYQRADYPPTPPPTPVPPTPGTPVPPTPTFTVDQYAYCPNPGTGSCTTNPSGTRDNTALKLNAYPDSRPAFWRADEIRAPHDAPDINGGYQDSYRTTTTYTLWHFNPRITSAFDPPSTLSDQPGGASLAQYTGSTSNMTDLRWYQPSGFDIKLNDPNDPSCNYGGGDCFERESTNGFYFYLYVKGIGGSSENNFDLRAGPRSDELASGNANFLCTDSYYSTQGGGLPYKTDCYVNKLYYDNSLSTLTDWQTGGAVIFAKRAMPVNLDTGPTFSFLFTQLSRNAAGQTLTVGHFDQDCDSLGNCGYRLKYQMQICGQTDTTKDSTFANLNQDGFNGRNNMWYDPGNTSGYDKIVIPDVNSQFFKNGGTSCQTSWLRLYRDPSYSQDTTVWEMPFLRPRLIK